MEKKRKPAGTLTNLAKEIIAKKPESTNAEIAMYICKKLGRKFDKHLMGGSRVKKLRDEYAGIITKKIPIKKIPVNNKSVIAIKKIVPEIKKPSVIKTPVKIAPVKKLLVTPIKKMIVQQPSMSHIFKMEDIEKRLVSLEKLIRSLSLLFTRH